MATLLGLTSKLNNWHGILGCLGLLLFLFFSSSNNFYQLFTIEPINHYSLDPFIYTSYINNYSDLIERYGRTYYSCRFGFLYPARFLSSIFGAENGYFAFRYLLLAGMCSAIWRISVFYFQSKKLAFLSICLILFHPWLLRSLFWNYVDGVAAVYLIISLSFLIVPRGKFRFYLSGAFFSLAFNCNVLTAPIFAAFLPSWFLLEREAIAKTSLLQIFAGAAFVHLSFMGISYWETPQLSPFFDSATFKIVKYLATAGCGQWMMSLGTLLSLGKFYLLFPPFLLLLLFAVYKKGNLQAPSYGLAAGLYLLLLLLFYALSHFAFDICILCFFYFSYLIPAVLFLFIWILGEALGSNPQNWICAAIGGAICALWLAAPYFVNSVQAIPAAGFLVLGTLILLVSLHPKLQAAAFCAALVLSPLVFYRDEIYAGIHEKGRQDWDVYRGAIALQELVSSHLDPRAGKVGFWYSNKPENRYLNSVQAMYLWLYSRLCTDGPGIQGMPVVEDYFRKNIGNYQYIALLGDEKEIAAGVEAIKAEGIAFEQKVKKEFESGSFKYSVLILEKQPL